MPRPRLLSSCAALAVAVSTAGTAIAQDAPVTLRMSHWVPETHPIQQYGMTDWAESIHDASDGTISIDFFPAQQLGQAGDHYDMARDGIADITFVNAGYQPGRFPIVGAGELPFLFSNATGGSAALDAWYRPHAEEEMSDVHFCLVHLHAPGTFHARSPIRVPDDIDGMNVRPAHATMANFISELGGQNSQVSAPEARDALSRGVADAITFPWNSILLFGIDEAVSYHTDMPLYATTFAWVMNQGSYDRLSEDQRAVIDDHCSTEWAERVATGWAEVEESGREEIMGMDGHEVIELRDDEVALWQEAAMPLIDIWADAVAERGLVEDPMALLDDLMAEIEERGASY